MKIFEVLLHGEFPVPMFVEVVGKWASNSDEPTRAYSGCSANVPPEIRGIADGHHEATECLLKNLRILLKAVFQYSCSEFFSFPP